MSAFALPSSFVLLLLETPRPMRDSRAVIDSSLRRARTTSDDARSASCCALAMTTCSDDSGSGIGLEVAELCVAELLSDKGGAGALASRDDRRDDRLVWPSAKSRWHVLFWI